MTDNEKATRLIYRIESTLATLTRWTANELDRFADVGADDLDITTLEHVSAKLDGVEGAWTASVQASREERAKRKASSIDPEIRALLDASGRCPSESTGSMYENPYPPAVQR